MSKYKITLSARMVPTIPEILHFPDAAAAINAVMRNVLRLFALPINKLKFPRVAIGHPLILNMTGGSEMSANGSILYRFNASAGSNGAFPCFSGLCFCSASGCGSCSDDKNVDAFPPDP